MLPLQVDAMLLGLRLSSWRIFLVANVFISLLALCGLYMLPETPKYQLVQGRVEEALQTLRNMYAQNSRRSASDYPVQYLLAQRGGASLSNVHGFCDAVKLIWQQTVPLFYRSRVLHTLNICSIQFMIYTIAQGVFMWFPTILNELSRPSAQNHLLCTVRQGINSDVEPEHVLAGGEASCNALPDIGTYQVMITIGAAFTIIYLIFAYIIDLVGKRSLLSELGSGSGIGYGYMGVGSARG